MKRLRKRMGYWEHRWRFWIDHWDQTRPD